MLATFTKLGLGEVMSMPGAEPGIFTPVVESLWVAIIALTVFFRFFASRLIFVIFRMAEGRNGGRLLRTTAEADV